MPWVPQGDDSQPPPLQPTQQTQPDTTETRNENVSRVLRLFWPLPRPCRPHSTTAFGRKQSVPRAAAWLARQPLPSHLWEVRRLHYRPELRVWHEAPGPKDAGDPPEGLHHVWGGEDLVEAQLASARVLHPTEGFRPS